MTYRRVLPRDLFNEGDLLKMLGRLWILLQETPGHDARIVEEEVHRFDIVQDESSGAIRVANLTFEVAGRPYRLERPLNSRSAWSLWLTCEDDDDFEEVRVFDEQGDLSEEMRNLLVQGFTGTGRTNGIPL